MGSVNAYMEVWKPAGVELVPLSGMRVTIGRAKSNDVTLAHDKTVGRLHAVIEPVADGWASARRTTGLVESTAEVKASRCRDSSAGAGQPECRLFDDLSECVAGGGANHPAEPLS